MIAQLCNYTTNRKFEEEGCTGGENNYELRITNYGNGAGKSEIYFRFELKEFVSNLVGIVILNLLNYLRGKELNELLKKQIRNKQKRGRFASTK